MKFIMGTSASNSLDTSTPTLAPPKVNKYPHVAVKNGSVDFYSEVDGKQGSFVCHFSMTKQGNTLVLKNLSFESGPPVALSNDAFNSTHGPLVLTSKVYKTLDDYKQGKSMPLSDVKGALEQS